MKKREKMAFYVFLGLGLYFFAIAIIRFRQLFDISKVLLWTIFGISLGWLIMALLVYLCSRPEINLLIQRAQSLARTKINQIKKREEPRQPWQPDPDAWKHN